MRIGHISDLHLGFTRFYREAVPGYNQRAADVSAACREAFARIVAAQPDLVLIAGDVFHSARPNNRTIIDAFEQVSRLRAGLPGVPIVIIAGNHDMAMTSDVVCAINLFRKIPGVAVVIDGAEWLDYPALDLRVLAVPDSALRMPTRPDMKAQGLAGTEIMVLHAPIDGIGEGARSHIAVQPSDLDPAFAYIGIGDYHECQQVRDNAWYSGAIEFTSPDSWKEARSGIPKGWLLVDLVDGVRTVTQQVIPTRRYLELPTIEGYGKSASEIMDALAASIAAVPDGHAGAVLRQPVNDLSKDVERQLNHAQIRRWQSEALHYQLDPRRPAAAVTVGTPDLFSEADIPVRHWMYDAECEGLEDSLFYESPESLVPLDGPVPNVDYDGNPFDLSDPVLLSAQALLGPHPYDQAAA